MIYWIPALECQLTESELKKAMNGNRIDDSEYIAMEYEDICKLQDMEHSEDMYQNENIPGNLPYVSPTPIISRKNSMIKSWLIDGLAPESYGYRRNRLRDEIFRMEERFSYIDSQLNNLNRMLSHTVVIEGKHDGNTTVATIDTRAIKLIREKEVSISLILRYLKDLYLAMYEEIDESMSMKTIAPLSKCDR